MDTCTVETGLLKKAPCGHAAVTRCLNCEQPLCAKHALPEPTEGGRKSGKFLCKECEAARRQFAKTPTPAAVKKPAEPAKPPPAAAAKPAAPAAPSAPAAADPAAPKPGYDGGIDFTPGKK